MRIAADLAEHRLDLTVRKEILWESETATDAEVREMERHFIRATGANNPAIGYNLSTQVYGVMPGWQWAYPQPPLADRDNPSRFSKLGDTSPATPINRYSRKDSDVGPISSQIPTCDLSHSVAQK